MRISLYRPAISLRWSSSSDVPSGGIRPDNINAALELSSNAEGGTRSLKGCRISGGSSWTRSSPVLCGVGFVLRVSYRRSSHTLERLFTEVSIIRPPAPPLD